MTPEREAQMREMYEKQFPRPINYAPPWVHEAWHYRLEGFLACARALEPMVKDGKRMRWLLDGNGFFMEEQGLCGYAPCSDEEKNAARHEIDAAMSAALEEKSNATD